MQTNYIYCHLLVLECSDCWIAVINMRLSMIWYTTEASQSVCCFVPRDINVLLLTCTYLT